MGPLALIVGVILCLVAFATDTAPSGTHNLGLLQQQMMTLHSGLALLIVSAIRFPTLEPKQRVYETITVEEHEAREAARKRKDLISVGIVLGVTLVVVILIALAGR